LAVRILSTSLPQLAAELAEYSESLEKEVLAKVDTLAEAGWEQYAVNMQK
jgi:phosphoribosylcarboxyaminoimidazole (NCAIR) mutase